MAFRRLLAGGLLLVATAAVPAGAAVQGPVTVVTRNDSHGVGVGIGLGNQPLVGVGTYDGRVCVGVSLQVPFCANAAQRVAS